MNKLRGHRKENVEVNQAIIALWICGFSQWATSRLLQKDRWNIQKIQKKFYDRHAPTIMNNICEYIVRQGTKAKPKKKDK